MDVPVFRLRGSARPLLRVRRIPAWRHWWRTHCAGDTPSTSKSTEHGHWLQPRATRPLGYAQRDAGDCDRPVILSILRLRPQVCPAAIIRTVIAVVITTVQRRAIRPRRHIRDESCDIVPAFAHTNAAPAVTVISGILHVVAPRHHRRPRGVKRMPVQAVLVPARLHDQRVSVSPPPLVVRLTPAVAPLRLIASRN